MFSIINYVIDSYVIFSYVIIIPVISYSFTSHVISYDVINIFIFILGYFYDLVVFVAFIVFEVRFFNGSILATYLQFLVGIFAIRISYLIIYDVINIFVFVLDYFDSFYDLLLFVAFIIFQLFVVTY